MHKTHEDMCYCYDTTLSRIHAKTSSSSSLAKLKGNACGRGLHTAYSLAE